MHLRQFVLPSLGHVSALIADDARGVAAVVDPRRDVDIYLAEARAKDLRISHVFETHLHNDYVSGARELAALTGAVHVMGAGAELATPFLGLRDGETADVGSLRFVAIDTPGHTPEHVSYAVADRSRAAEPALLFTGGSLLVGAVGRTDLLGAENARPFARAMFSSLHEKLLPHHDYVGVLPTHGAGSLCSKSISSTPSSTVGYERRHNPLLQVDEIEAFVDALLVGQPAFPRYFARMRSTNQGGPRSIGGVPGPRPLGLDRVCELLAGEHLLVDLRSPSAHAVAHVPGSISIPAGDSFGTWLGWVVDFDRPLVLLLERSEDWDDAVRQALRIGFDHVEGHVQGGFGAWQDSGAPIEASGRLTVAQLQETMIGAADGRAPLILDVRQADEFAAAHVPGAVHFMCGDLPDRLAELPRDRPILAMCASGLRSSIAASLLRRAGFEDVSWVSGGVPAWRKSGFPVEQGA